MTSVTSQILGYIYFLWLNQWVDVFFQQIQLMSVYTENKFYTMTLIILAFVPTVWVLLLNTNVFGPWSVTLTVNGGVWSSWETWMTPCCVFFCDELGSPFSSRPSHCRFPGRNGYEIKTRQQQISHIRHTNFIMSLHPKWVFTYKYKCVVKCIPITSA